jgi:hypothetical protein
MKITIKNKLLLEQQLLIEGRIDDARKASPFVQLIDAVTKEFKSNHTPLVDNWAGQDPTNNQKYLVWVMKQAEAGIARLEDNVSHVRKRLQQWLEKGSYDVRPDSEEGQMSPEERKNAQRTTIENYITDLQKDELKVGFAMKTEILANFDKLVKRKMIRGNEADINNYKDWSELDAKVDEALEELERRQQEKEAKKNIDIIYKGDDFFIFEPMSFQASCHFAQRYGETGGTRWCISSDDYPQYWRDYISEGNRFVFVFTGLGDKYSIQNNDWEQPQELSGHTAKHGTTVWDADDDPMSFEDFVSDSGLPPELVDKIREHYSDKYGFEVHDEALPEDKELEEARWWWENAQEDEDVIVPRLEIGLESDEDEIGRFVMEYVNFSVFIPKSLVGSDADAESGLDRADDEIIELLDNNDYLDGYVDGITVEMNATETAHAINVSWQPNRASFDAASEFYDVARDLRNALDRETVYEYSNEDLVVEDLPTIPRKILYAMALEVPDSARVEWPEYENFGFRINNGSRWDADIVSDKIRVARLPDKDYDVVGNFSRRRSFEGLVQAALAEWISNAVGAEQLELGREPDEELANKRKSDLRSNLEKNLTAAAGTDFPEEGKAEIIVKLEGVVDLPIAQGSAIAKAVEVMDNNWNTVQQIVLKQFKKEWPDKPLAEGKSPRKLRIKIK